MSMTGAMEPAEDTQSARSDAQASRKLPPLARAFECAAPQPPLEDNERVVRLREWGTDQATSLESQTRFSLSGNEAVEWDGERWWTQGVTSTGACRRTVLTSGSELLLASGKLLIAESRRCVALRDVCRRLLGWRADRQHAVDRALRSIRCAIMSSGAIVILGPGELSSIARALHRVLRGPSAPFVSCSPSCKDLRASAIVPGNLRNTREACEAATGGSLVVRTTDMPRDFFRIADAAGLPFRQLLIFVCATEKSSFRYDGFAHVDMRDFDGRKDEIPRLVEEYAREAGELLGAPPGCFRDQDRQWVTTYAASSVVDIERGTLYQTALRMTRTPREAARLLGVTEGTLGMYLSRRSER